MKADFREARLRRSAWSPFTSGGACCDEATRALAMVKRGPVTRSSSSAFPPGSEAQALRALSMATQFMIVGLVIAGTIYSVRRRLGPSLYHLIQKVADDRRCLAV